MKYGFKTKFVSAVDGDTVKLMIDHGLNVFSLQILRLARVNTPEMKDSNPEVRKKAVEAKDALTTLCTGPHPISVEIIGRDTYGRWIAEVFVGEINLSDWLISNHHGVFFKLK